MSSQLASLLEHREQNIGKTMESIDEKGGPSTSTKTSGESECQPEVVKLSLKGDALLTNPRWNKGSAFTSEERDAFALRARLPYQVDPLDLQLERAYNQYLDHETPIRKNAFLQSLKSQNWVLYFALLQRHLKEMMPIVYTPTEAEAIAKYSTMFRRSEGLYLSYPHEGTMEEDFLGMIEGREFDLVVCSDAEAILGIGDQGVGGIGISTAKAVIYSVVGGIDPAKALAIILDVGTDNQSLLKDELYVGWAHERVRGDDYDRFVDKFMQLVRRHLPNSLVHFEDFGVTNAQRLLDRYRDKHAVFNDDVQGTGAITLATLMSAVGVARAKLSEQTIVLYGAGSAGLGIVRQVRDAMVALDGIDRAEATKRFWLVDKHGLVTREMAAQEKRPGWEEFAHDRDEESDGGLLSVVKRAKATVLIGTSTHSGGFTEDVIKALSANAEYPIILPLSNPSRLVEVEPQRAMEWSEGRALIATGSPFPEVDLPNGNKAIIAECNNALIYPGLGFGAVLSRSRTMTDAMLIAGTRRLAELSPAFKSIKGESGEKGSVEDKHGNVPPLLPDFDEVPHVNFEVAISVAEAAIDEGVARIDWGKEEVRKKAEEMRWTPQYARYEYDPQGRK